jgi:hypothetical protein
LPIWIGAKQIGRALRRVAAVADGWIANLRPGHGLEEALAFLQLEAEQIGRVRPLPWQGVVDLASERSELARQFAAVYSLGADYCSVTTVGCGLTPSEHIAALPAIAGDIGLI